MYNLIESAISEEKNEDYSFYLEGDLCQMSSQREALNSRGVQTKQNNVYPCVKECDKTKALTIIWENRVEGWWHYEDLYVKRNICTKDEFQISFNEKLI